MEQNFVPSTNDYFEECRGFYPDLWVPADEAEELAVKLMENLGAVQAGRQADGKPGRGAGRRRSIQPGRIKRRRLP